MTEPVNQTLVLLRKIATTQGKHDKLLASQSRLILTMKDDVSGIRDIATKMGVIAANIAAVVAMYAERDTQTISRIEALESRMTAVESQSRH